ncbi:MAG: SDR family oxidoreductase [Verrucomicrobiae bacterium]|nr:SDR family oxidoreductase [Verrucomicrobiae bacterium]
MKLQRRHALITGASQGLGKAIARQFLLEGASVALCARDARALSATAAELGALAKPGQKVVARPCDVSSPKEVGELVEFALRELGPLQALVNNAGIYGPMGPTESVDWDEWVRAVEINLYGTLLPCRALVPHFKRAGYGKIVNLSGGGATAPLPNISAYAASKAAVVRLVETLAEELKPFRVDVNAIAPGALNTRLLDQVFASGKEAVGAGFYARALKQKESGGVPLELGAKLCVYLASAESDGITGRLISAQWDPWPTLHAHRDEIAASDIYTLRRILPKDRGKPWGES